jgi:hypothetical protein
LREEGATHAAVLVLRFASGFSSSAPSRSAILARVLQEKKAGLAARSQRSLVVRTWPSKPSSALSVHSESQQRLELPSGACAWGRRYYLRGVGGDPLLRPYSTSLVVAGAVYGGTWREVTTSDARHIGSESQMATSSGGASAPRDSAGSLRGL